jgi:hypothetical protein
MQRTLNFLLATVFTVSSSLVASGQDCTLEWERSDEESPFAQGSVFTLDADENAYIAYHGSIGLGIIKYDSDGNVVWDVEREESSHAIRDISVDADGNIFLSGYTYSFSNGQVHGQGIWLMKFDGNGGFQWEALELGYMGPINQYPPLCKHRVDANDDIYVVGSSLNATIDYRILKYSTSGTLLWQRSAGEPLNVDFPVAMDLSPDGKLAVTGGGFGGFFFTVVYDASGTKLWQVTEFSASGASDVKFTASGDVIAVGSKWDVNTSMDFLVLTYDPAGNLVSTQTYDDNGGWEAARRFEIDPQGNYIISGIQSGGYVNWLTMKVSPSSSVLWKAVYDATADYDELPNDLALDASGDVYVTGTGGPRYVNGPFFVNSMVTVRYDGSSGDEACILLRQNLSTNGRDIEIAPSSFYVLGGGNREFVKYNGTGGSCPTGEIADCNGNCAPVAWVADGICDDGARIHNGVPILLDCDAFGNDAGDCDIVSDVDNLATADSATDEGSITDGSFLDTHAQDNVYESLTEGQTAGNPANRRSLLSHTWTVDVVAGDGYAFLVDAYHTANTEGDDFVFSYSLDDLVYTPMVTVTKTSDDNTLQAYMFTEDVAGTVYVRVEDTDHTMGHSLVDTILVDAMAIVTFSPDDGTPPPPCPADTDGSDEVNVDDLTAVLLDWGTDGSQFNGDVDGSGMVDVDDLTAVILAWGPCP